MPEKILVMDEQDEVCRRLREILGGEGYAVVVADNMADGLRLLQAEAPDLVIADIKLSLDQCYHKLHDNNSLDMAVDIIVMATEDNREAAIRWLGKGAYDFLPKPVADYGMLAAVVGRALQKRRLVLDNHRLSRQLEQVTIKDPLTGIYNHRHMYKCIMDEVVRGSRYNRPFLLMIADIDQFGRLNETYGRHAGDMVLTRMARLLEDSLRVADVVFRYDGGKFAFLLPETRVHQGIRVAERILEEVRYHTFDCGESNAQVTISVGMAEFPSEARDVSSLIEIAGQRLQGVKKAGGDGFQSEDRLGLVSECDS